MKIIKQINNNAALAVDGSGKELVVLLLTSELTLPSPRCMIHPQKKILYFKFEHRGGSNPAPRRFCQ